MRPTRAVVDLSAIARNFARVRERAGPDRAIYAVLKADAYGHGAVPVARRLTEEGADRFAVAIAEEGVVLRRGGVRGEILLMSYCDPEEIPLLRAYALTPALYAVEQGRAFAQAARGLPEPLSVHVKLDTGMGRSGVREEDLAEFAAILREAERLAVRGAFSQLASAEQSGAPATTAQIAAMRRMLGLLRDAGVSYGIAHLANSAGLLAHSDSLFDAVRPGLALYGIPPAESFAPAGLEPALTLLTSIAAIKRVPAGSPLGYGGRFVTARASRIALLPIGYHDGFRRALSGRVSALVRGMEAPVVGAVSMDLTLLDVTDVEAAPGDEVVCLGTQGGRSILAWDLARAADTIPYEILCGLSPRVPRICTG